MAQKYVRKDWHQSEDHNHRLAAFGEDVAARYVTEKMSMKIIGRNVRFKIGEIDIVALSGNLICFIEVKTRSNLKYGVPCLAINRKKQRTLVNLAKLYQMYYKQYANYQPRIDVAEVLVMNGKVYFHYIPCAVYDTNSLIR